MINNVVKKLFVYLLLVIIFSNLVYAADVAYILLNERAAKSEILDVFSDLGLSVDLIKDSNILNYNLANYRLIFIDDLRYRKTKNLPIYNYPSVIMNYYYGREFGLTDNDGISQLAANSPLNVRVDGSILQVYTQAKIGSVGIPYYFLDDQNKVQGILGIARTYTGNGGVMSDFGDVIGIIPVGTQLTNGKPSQGKMCYYGIAKTKYWTENARNLFIDCVENILIVCENDLDCNDSNGYTFDYCENPGTINSECIHEQITCLNDNDCNDLNGYTEDECINAGTTDSFCQHNPIICITNSDCDDSNQYTDDVCENPGTSLSYCNYYDIACFTNPDCNDNNPLTQDVCNLPGTRNSYCSSYIINCFTNADCNDLNDYTSDICQNPGTASSFCENIDITCLTNLDCGISGYTGDYYCNNNNAYRDYLNHACFNPGQTSSYCSTDISSILQETCDGTLCYNGDCVVIPCFTNADCDDSNIYTQDVCNLPGTINSFCTHGNIACIIDLDCGADNFINGLYCLGINLYRDFLSYDCNNPGAINSFCSNDINPIFEDTCTYACSEGNCVRCNFNSDCDDTNDYTYDICNLPGTINSYCSYETIICRQDSDCGINGYITGPYCFAGDVYRDYRTFNCNDPGSVGSYCNNDIEAILNETCLYGCSGGACLPPINDVALADLKFEFTNGTLIPGIIPQLITGNSYKILVDLINQGNFSENVSFNGEIRNNNTGVLVGTFTHTAVNNIVPGEIKDDKVRTVLFNFPVAFYNVSILAISESTDDDPPDNFISRLVEVIFIACYSDADCDDFDPLTQDTCINPGTINSFCQYEDICIDQDIDDYNVTGGLCGLVDCNDLNPFIYPGATELCNNLDDDCDSNIDEDFTNLDETCSVGVGECLSYGTYICSGNGLTTVCNATPGTPVTEICDDGLDNDCDGLADCADSDCFDSGWQTFKKKSAICIDGCDSPCFGWFDYCGCSASGFNVAWLQKSPQCTGNGYKMLCQGNYCIIAKGNGIGYNYDIPSANNYYVSVRAEWGTDNSERLYMGVNTFGDNANRRLVFDFSAETSCVFRNKFNINSDPAKIWAEASSNSGSVHVKNIRISQCLPAGVTRYCDDGSIIP